MKGVILAGGTGSRLRPITHNTAKQLIPLGPRSVLEHVIENFKRAGITDLGLVIGNDSADAIQTAIGDGSHLDVDITYLFQGEPLGLAHAVGCAQDFVGDEPFVVYFGDTILDHDITERLCETFDPSIYDVGIPLQRVENPTRFGIAQFDEEGNVKRFLEKPDDPPSNLAYVGAVAFAPDFFEIIEDLEPSSRGELELTDAIDECVRGDGDAAVIEVEGTWKDVGTPSDVIETNELLLRELTPDVQGSVHETATVEGPLVLGPGSTVAADATVIGPVVIGKDTTIEAGSRIGPYATVGDGCSIRSGGLESSVVFDDVVVDTSRTVTESIVGRRATLRETPEDESISGLIGWDSTIDL